MKRKLILKTPTEAPREHPHLIVTVGTLSAELPDHCLAGTPPVSFATKGKLHHGLITDRPIPTASPATRNRRVSTPNPRLQGISTCLFYFSPALSNSILSVVGNLYLRVSIILSSLLFSAHSFFPLIQPVLHSLGWPLPSFIWPPSPTHQAYRASHRRRILIASSTR